MPELPEVETVRRGLSELIIGKTIQKVAFDWPKGFPNAQADIDRFLVRASIRRVRRRAKVLLIDLDTEYTLVIHLKMTGQLVFRGEGVAFGAGHPNDSLIGDLPDKSTRVVFCMSDKKDVAFEASTRNSRRAQGDVQKVRRPSTGADDKVITQKHSPGSWHEHDPGECGAHLFFNDQRKFGWVRLMPTIEIENLDFFKKLGPEPLHADFTQQLFRERLLRRANTNIKAALLDQSVIAGVGNIYADESLWGAKIHPTTLVKNVSTRKLNTLFTCLRDVLALSIEKGGSSDKNYVDAEGRRGSYLTFANVFRREGQPCSRCATIIQKSRVAGRGTHTCPRCQKLPK